MLAGRALQFIQNPEPVRFVKADTPAVPKSTTAASGVQRIRPFPRFPGQDFDFRKVSPGKGSRWNGLVAAVEPDGIVSGRTSKAIPPDVIGVGVSPWVNQKFPARAESHDAQRVRMTVAGVPGAEGSGIHDDPRVSRGEHGDTRVPKEAGGGCIARSHRGQAQAGTTEALGAGRQCRAAESISRPVRVKQTAPIVIAEEGYGESGCVERVQILCHRTQLAAELLRLRGQHIVQQEEIHGVNLIIGGLLEVAAIVPHLGAHLLSHQTGAEGGPLRGMRKCGEQDTKSVQRYGFAEEMGVRREVDREISCQVTTVAV